MRRTGNRFKSFRKKTKKRPSVVFFRILTVLGSSKGERERTEFPEEKTHTLPKGFHGRLFGKRHTDTYETEKKEKKGRERESWKKKEKAQNWVLLLIVFLTRNSQLVEHVPRVLFRFVRNAFAFQSRLESTDLPIYIKNENDDFEERLLSPPSKRYERERVCVYL